jgi:hypothetical protein
MVIHAFNTTYFRGGDRSITSLRLAQTKVKQNTKTKGLGVWLKRNSACLARTRPLAESLVPLKESERKTERERQRERKREREKRTHE